MLRLLAVAVLSLVANAIGLVVASVVLDDVGLEWSGFLVAVAIFTGVAVLIEPLVRQTAMKNVPALLGSTALIATLISLVVTHLVTDGLDIRGAVTWVLATVIVWVVALAARLLLPLVVFKKVLADNRSR